MSSPTSEDCGSSSDRPRSTGKTASHRSCIRRHSEERHQRSVTARVDVFPPGWFVPASSSFSSSSISRARHPIPRRPLDTLSPSLLSWNRSSFAPSLTFASRVSHRLLLLGSRLRSARRLCISFASSLVPVFAYRLELLRRRCCRLRRLYRLRSDHASPCRRPCCICRIRRTPHRSFPLAPSFVPQQRCLTRHTCIHCS